MYGGTRKHLLGKSVLIQRVDCPVGVTVFSIRDVHVYVATLILKPSLRPRTHPRVLLNVLIITIPRDDCSYMIVLYLFMERFLLLGGLTGRY